MARRVGIELSPSRCAIVEVETGERAQRATRVRMFRSIPYNADNPVSLAGTLQQMRASRMVGRHVVVALSGIRAAHQLMTLPPAKGRDLEMLALREAKKNVPLLNEGETCTAVLSPPSTGAPLGRHDVTFVAASATDVRARVAPLVSSGFVVDAVTTVPVALASLSTLLHRHAGDAVLAYAVVNGDATTLAIVRNGVVLFAREIPLHTRTGADFAGRLGAEIKRSFLYFKQTSKLDVQRLFVCGEFPDLRLLTAPLIHALDIEVETLDSLDGIDPTDVPGRDGDVRDHVGELRVAWAAASDRSRPLDLMPVAAATQREAGELLKRIAVWAIAAVVLVAVFYALAWGMARGAEKQGSDLRADIARLEPQLGTLEQRRVDRTRDQAAQAMLAAVQTQGPRLARVLEAVGRSAPDQVVLDSLTATADGVVWRLPIEGHVNQPVASAAQAEFSRFLVAAQSFPLLGVPVVPPTLKLATANVQPLEPTPASAFVNAAFHRQSPALGALGGADVPRRVSVVRPVSTLDFTVEFEVKK